MCFKKITFLLFINLFMISANLFAENEKDSLESILPFAPEKERCDILNGLAQLTKSPDTTKAAGYARQALALSNKLNYCRGKATATIILGILNKNKSNFNQARIYYLQGLALGLKCKEPYSVSLAYHSLGNLALIKGDYPVALKYYIASLKLSEQLNDYRRIAKTLTNVATLYFELNRFQEGEHYYLRALTLHKNLNDELSIAEVSNNLGNIYLSKGYQLKALFYYSTALEVFRRIGSIYDISSVLNNIGVIYQQRNQHNKSKPYFLESLSLDIAAKDYKAQALAASNLSLVYDKINKKDSAVYYADMAIAITTAQDLLHEQIEAYTNAAVVYKNTGNNAKAKTYHEKAETLKNKINSSYTHTAVNNLQGKYEAEKKEITLKLLAKDNEIKQLKINEQKKTIANRNIIIILGTTVLFFMALAIALFIYLLGAKKATKEIELNNTAKTNLLNKINHELRTPLNSILGMTQLAVESKNYNELKEYLLNIKLSGEELTFVLSNIINYLQISNKQAKAEEVPYHLKDMLDEIFKIYHSFCKNKGILFTNAIGIDVPEEVIADRFKIQTIINNLFYNAFRHTQKGVVNIHVKQAAFKATEKGNLSTLQVIVSDEGEGLKENEIKNLFKHGHKNKERGFGIGLFVIKELTKLVNGNITLTSEIGVGSTFIFEFDVKINDSYSFNPNKLNNQLNVLVVEDNLLNQKLITKILDKEKIQYQIATTGIEALNKLTEKSFNAILLDIGLPELNGFEVAYRIRNHEEYSTDKNIPIIALSANEDTNEHKKCIEVGINEYLSKPINKELLIKYLYRLS